MTTIELNKKAPGIGAGDGDEFLGQLNPNSTGNPSASQAETPKNGFLLEPLTTTARNILKAVKNELKDKCGAEYQAKKINGKWVGPQAHAMPIDKLKECRGILIESGGLRPHEVENEFEFVPFDAPKAKPKHVKEAEKIEIHAQRFREQKDRLLEKKADEK